jgi:recombinational DNA repair protein RecR
MWEIKKEIETRKENLILILKNKKDLLALEKQHQIYGAIKELDHVIRLMEQYRDNEKLSQPKQMSVQTAYEELTGGEEEEEEVVQKQETSAPKVVKERIRKFKYPIRIKFAKSDA